MKWKLINRDVQNGLVTINNKDLGRLIQEAIRNKIQSDLPLEVNEYEEV